MHEAALAKRLLRAAIKIARERGARRILSVRGWIADSELISRASIEAHFAANANGTVAEGARLDLQFHHLEARCGQCGVIYPPVGHLTLCPRCGSPEGYLMGEPGTKIESLVVED